MATESEITLAKGSFSVTLYASQVEDGFVNKIFKIAPPRGEGQQSSGQSENKVVDLLRITRSFRIKGHIISNEVKSDLISIIRGGGVNGGGITMTYSGGGDQTSFTVFTESCIFTQAAQDEPVSAPDDMIKHDVNITLVEGETV